MWHRSTKREGSKGAPEGGEVGDGDEKLGEGLCAIDPQRTTREAKRTGGWVGNPHETTHSTLAGRGCP